MDRIAAPAGRDQRPSEGQAESPTRDRVQKQHQNPDALDALHNKGQPGQARLEAGTPSLGTPSAGLSSHAKNYQYADSVRILTDESGSSTAPPSPSTRPASLATATTAVSSPGRPRAYFRSSSIFRASEPGTMHFLVVLARLAAFTVVFLSGLIIPLITALFVGQADIPYHQVQIWTSVLVAAYGGALAVTSPLMPLLLRRDRAGYFVLLAGLVCSAAAFALFQAARNIYLFIIARVLQGLAAAAVTGAASGLLATAARHGSTCNLSPVFVQSAGMAAGPLVAGLLYDDHLDAVFYCAYALVALNIVLVLVAIKTTPINETSETDEPAGLRQETGLGGYGTVPSGAGGFSRISSWPISPTAPPPSGSGQQSGPQSLVATVRGNPRLSAALSGYIVLGLLTSALYTVLPLFLQRHLNWSVFASGSMFVPLFAPAALLGPLAAALAGRVPNSARYLAAFGFLACIPAFLHLGQLRTTLVEHGILLTLGGLSLATGICGGPLVREIANGVGSSASDTWAATALAASLPALADAWGSLIGPLLAGAVNWLWGWQAMAASLAIVSAASGVLSLLFLQGWIRSPYRDVYTRDSEARTDEESAPLLANDRSARALYGQAEGYSGKTDNFSRQRKVSDDVSPHTRPDSDRKSRSHRRHFSVDNFSVATTTTPGSMDSSTSSVRFQAALETPPQGPTNSSTTSANRPPTGDSKASAERRYVMREAPHAPATDPLLAAGSLYVIDEERDTGKGTTESRRQKRRVVVFPEGSAPPELLAKHRHHVVAINALDGTARMVDSGSGGVVENHAVHVTEEDEEFDVEGLARRYVVVVVEGEEAYE